MKVWRFLLALAFGRTIRFGLEGWLAVNFGDQAAYLFKQHYPKIGLGIAAAIITICVINILRIRRKKKKMLSDQWPVAGGH
jgi:membrane protein DedA with SNARE-associated domain